MSVESSFEWTWGSWGLCTGPTVAQAIINAMRTTRLVFDITVLLFFLLPTITMFFIGVTCSGTGICSESLESIYYVNQDLPYLTLPMLLLGKLNSFIELVFGSAVADGAVYYLGLAGVAFLVAAIVAFFGSIGFRIMSLREGWAAVKNDLFGFVITGLTIVFLIAEIV